MTLFRRRGGQIIATLQRQEVQVLRQCITEMAALLDDEPDRDDPAVERLFPDVYPEDPIEAAEFRRFTEADLKAAKLDQARAVLDSLAPSGGEVRLDESTADVWLRAINDVRLVLGTRLGVEDDTDLEAELDAAVGRDPSSPRVNQLSVYFYLGILLESLVDAITR
jgi:hypothetical protein